MEVETSEEVSELKMKTNDDILVITDSTNICAKDSSDSKSSKGENLSELELKTIDDILVKDSKGSESSKDKNFCELEVKANDNIEVITDSTTMEVQTSEEVSELEMKTNDDILVITDSTNICVKDSNDSKGSESSKGKNFTELEVKTNDDIPVITDSTNNCVKDSNDAKDSKSSKEMPSIENALSAIAMEYNCSESESEEIIESQSSATEVITEKTPAKVDNQENSSEIEILKEYRSHTEIVNSSDEVDSEEDSSSSDDSSEDSSDSDSSSDSTKREKINKIIETKNQKPRERQRKQSKGEFDDLPPIEDLNINVPEVLCDPLGEVAWIVDQMVVVRPKPGKPTLNIDSVLFVERGRRVLGRVFDVFGQVSDPHYCVRFNNSQHIEENNIKVGMNVYFCPNTEYTTVVFLHELSKMKACDPTDDDEPPQFSDDEEEQAYYQNLRKQQKNEKADSETGVPFKKKRNTGFKSTGGKQSSSSKPNWKSNHPWNAKRHVKNQHQVTDNRQIANSPGSCHPQNWQGSRMLQPNVWPQFSAFSNNAWPMYYPRNDAGNNIFRPHMGFIPPFQMPRFGNPVPWNVRNQTPLPQSIQTDNSSTGSVFALNPPPPPPPPTTTPSSTSNISPPGLQ